MKGWGCESWTSGSHLYFRNVLVRIVISLGLFILTGPADVLTTAPDFDQGVG